MTKQILIFSSVTIFLVSLSLPQKTGKEISTSETFAVANVRFEQNATDGDVEVVFEIKGGDDGLNKLIVVSPDNRTVIDFTAPDNSTLGIRQFRFESTEPKDVEGLKAAYPEGVYKFAGSTLQGTKFYSKCTLNHKLPETVSFLQPSSETVDLNMNNLEINWTPVKNVVSYILEIEQDELGIGILVKLPATSETKFTLHEDFLQPGMEYTLSIGTVAEGDNSSFVETTFSIPLEE